MPIEMIDEAGRLVPRQVVDPGGLGEIDRDFAPGELRTRLLASNPLRCSATTFRVAAHEALGGFDPGLRYVVDWDFWLRLACAWSIHWLAHPTVRMRWHEASETHRFRASTVDLDESLAVFERHLSDCPMPRSEVARLRYAAKRRLARALLNRAYSASPVSPALTRSCLLRALRADPRLLAELALDPRLVVRLVRSIASRSAAQPATDGGHDNQSV